MEVVIRSAERYRYTLQLNFQSEHFWLNQQSYKALNIEIQGQRNLCTQETLIGTRNAAPPLNLIMFRSAALWAEVVSTR